MRKLNGKKGGLESRLGFSGFFSCYVGTLGTNLV